MGKHKYRGEFEELRKLVARLGHPGEWVGDDKKRVYRTNSGAILNWWPSTGTVQCQGAAESRAARVKSLYGGSKSAGRNMN